MDTVISRVGGKVNLMFDFTFCNFMIGFLLPNKSASSVSSAILVLKKHLGEQGISFGTVFPIILTDNGGELSDVAAIENDLFGNKETHLFLCDLS